MCLHQYIIIICFDFKYIFFITTTYIITQDDENYDLSAVFADLGKRPS